MARYSQQLADEVDKVIPFKVREALRNHGWNEFGIYEAVKDAIKKVKKKGGKILVTNK
jgi:hypothetical protein